MSSNPPFDFSGITLKDINEMESKMVKPRICPNCGFTNSQEFVICDLCFADLHASSGDCGVKDPDINFSTAREIIYIYLNLYRNDGIVLPGLTFSQSEYGVIKSISNRIRSLKLSSKLDESESGDIIGTLPLKKSWAVW